MKRKKNTKTWFRGTRLSLVQQATRSRGRALSFTQTETEDESRSLRSLSCTKTKCAQISSLPISANLEISAFTHTTNLRLSIILVNLRQRSAFPRSMTAANIAAGLKRMRNRETILRNTDNLWFLNKIRSLKKRHQRQNRRKFLILSSFDKTRTWCNST